MLLGEILFDSNVLRLELLILADCAKLRLLIEGTDFFTG
jgi:hypothetical protein